MNTPIRIVVALTAYSLIGCSGGADRAHVEALERRVAALEAEKEADTTAADVFKVGARVLALEFAERNRATAYLRPNGTGYQVLPVEVGFITIAIKDVTPFANGSKVTLRVGNPLSSSIEGFKAKTSWGRVDEKGLPQTEGSQSKEVTFSESLEGGRWTEVTAVLEGLPPEQFGYLEFTEATHRGIRLAN